MHNSNKSSLVDSEMFTNFEIMSIPKPDKILFFFPAKGITLRSRNKLKAYLQSMFEQNGKHLGTINYIFCSDSYLLKINQQYLDHSFYTDIITFDLSDSDKILQAEIYISIDRVRENAVNLKVPVNTELHRVIFHGALHLCGYRDKSGLEKTKMAKLEDLWLSLYFDPKN